jgi:hypothetical protein
MLMLPGLLDGLAWVQVSLLSCPFPLLWEALAWAYQIKKVEGINHFAICEDPRRVMGTNTACHPDDGSKMRDVFLGSYNMYN